MSAWPRPATGVEVVARTLAIASTLLLMGVTVVDVLLRKTVGQGIPGSIEITEVVLVIAAYLGMMTAARDGMHVTVTFATARMRARLAQALRTLAAAVTVVTLAVVLYATTLRAVTSVVSGEFRFGLASVPIWPARIAIVVGLAAFAIAAALELVAAICRLRTGEAEPPSPGGFA